MEKRRGASAPPSLLLVQAVVLLFGVHVVGVRLLGRTAEGVAVLAPEHETGKVPTSSTAATLSTAKIQKIVCKTFLIPQIPAYNFSFIVA